MDDENLDIFDASDETDIDPEDFLDFGRSRWTPPKKRISPIQARRAVEEMTDTLEYQDLFDELSDEDY